MNQDITTLRSALFDTLEALRRKEDPIEIERARAINDVAQTIINSAKVEIDYMKTTGKTGSGFIPELPAPAQAPKGDTVQPVAGGRVITHRMPG